VIFLGLGFNYLAKPSVSKAFSENPLLLTPKERTRKRKNALFGFKIH